MALRQKWETVINDCGILSQKCIQYDLGNDSDNLSDSLNKLIILTKKWLPLLKSLSKSIQNCKNFNVETKTNFVLTETIISMVGYKEWSDILVERIVKDRKEKTGLTNVTSLTICTNNSHTTILLDMSIIKCLTVLRSLTFETGLTINCVVSELCKLKEFNIKGKNTKNKGDFLVYHLETDEISVCKENKIEKTVLLNS
jgi:hypothetical protein